MSARLRLKQIRQDEAGTVAVIWAMALVMVFGLMALSFDFGKISATHSELQTFADNVALAAAGELDGKTDAITRATAAAANLIADTQSFGTANAALNSADYTLTFYSDLPALDTSPLDPTDITTDPEEAIFASVAVQPHTIDLLFTSVASFLSGGANNISATFAATAVAGYTQAACDLTPVMFCLPQDAGGNTIFPVMGDMILLRSGGQGAGWGPGDFGWLDPTVYADLGGTCSGQSGNNLLRCLVGAIQNKTQCVNQRGVDTEPGQKVGIEDAALNTRFDIYKGSMASAKNDPNYAPAPNVISGYKQNCNPNKTASTNTKRMPRNDCFTSGTCSRFGQGYIPATSANYAQYMDMNFGDGDGIYEPSGDDATGAFVAGQGAEGAYAGTRYGQYLNEIAYGNNGPIIQAPGKEENGYKMCATVPPTGPERRVIIAAAIDCQANPINGKETGVPVEKFYEMFITEPIGNNGASPPTLDIYVEVIGEAGGDGYGSAGPGGIFRDVVQLYR